MNIFEKESSRSKVKQIVILSASLLIGLIFYQLVGFFKNLLDLTEVIPHLEEGRIALSIFLGFTTFILSYRVKIISKTLEMWFDEYSKILFPPGSESFKQSLIILVGVVLVGFLLGLFDVMSQWALSFIK